MMNSTNATNAMDGLLNEYFNMEYWILIVLDDNNA